MSTQVLISLPDDLLSQAQTWSSITQRDLSQTVTDALRIALTPLSVDTIDLRPIETLSDSEVLALSRVQMDIGQGERMGKLLQKQREGKLLFADQSELSALAQVYHNLWLRQSQALAESVQRGLRPALES